MSIELSDTITGFSNKNYPWDEIIDQLPMSGTLLEVGTGCGLSASTFAEKFNETGRDYTIHTIDQCHGFNIDGISYTSEQQLEYISQVVDAWDNISFTRCDFFKRYWETPTVLFLDASHTYRHTRNALRIMTKAEIILVDDYTPIFPGVMAAVDAFQQRTNKELTVFETGHDSNMSCAMFK
jgi:tRNA A58 N-methylase Trm61